jgi:alpha-ribazole phosphatase
MGVLGGFFMKTYKFHLIRHGLTEANDTGTYIGRTDLPLSGRGLTHLLDMAKEYTYPSATRFFTSPLLRCRQTLEVLYPHCEAEIADGLAECDFGDWEGRTVAQLKHDEAFLEWISGTRTDIPNGEDTKSFQQRAMAAFQEIVQECMKSGDTEVVVCTHGGIIMLLMAAFGLPQCDPKEWVCSDGAGFTLRVTPSVWMREPKAEALCAIPWKEEE